MNVDEIKQALRSPRFKMEKKKTDFLSSGSTLLNLACAGRVKGCFRKGHYYFYVGDSASGKTFLCLTSLAEAAIDKRFEDYRLIFDNAEDGALMDMERFFGPKLAARLEPPAHDEEGRPKFSTTIEEFYYHADDAVAEGRPFIYILDSMDALSSDYEQSKFEETKSAHRRGKETTGSMGDGKAKKNSAMLRQLIAKIRDTDSILIIICQTRDAIGSFPGFDTKTRSGGRALKFYATLEIWTSLKDKIKRTVKGKLRRIGIKVKVHVKKNRETGKDRIIHVPIYDSVGIDDLGSCVDYLVEEQHWKETKGKIKALEFDFEGSREALIQKIEREGSENELRSLVGQVWREIEEASRVERKSRYH